MNKPNHICKTCGEEYYACDFCYKQHEFVSWRSLCCSPKCYQEYIALILNARVELEPITVKTVVTPVIPETEKAEIVADSENIVNNTWQKSKYRK